MSHDQQGNLVLHECYMVAIDLPIKHVNICILTTLWLFYPKEGL